MLFLEAHVPFSRSRDPWRSFEAALIPVVLLCPDAAIGDTQCAEINRQKIGGESPLLGKD
jgi:hypothetical protein